MAEDFMVALKKSGAMPKDYAQQPDPVLRRIVKEYGAVFVASDVVKKPAVCMFTSEEEVLEFQQAVPSSSIMIDGAKVELQAAALDALIAAREEAGRQGLDITPRGGAEASRRSYADTLRLWNSRLVPALKHWVSQQRISEPEAARIKELPIRSQVSRVLEMEKTGIFFSTDFSKSILYSVAIPGASQHNFMLAFDVAQFEDVRVRQILERHGWFQTVKNDLPHFTYLGMSEHHLSALGLQPVVACDQRFWIPNLDDE